MAKWTASRPGDGPPARSQREAEEQRHGEPADRPGAELKQERRRDQRRHVRVDQRPEYAAEAGVDRRAHASLRLELFLDALEDQHVGIDADPHRQHETGDAGQCHDRADVGHQPQQDDEVEDQRHHRVHPGQFVVNQHEHRDEQQTDH
jgi:hypothetical protein